MSYPGPYTVEVCSSAEAEPFRTITRVATDHPDGSQSVVFQGVRFQLFERTPGRFWIDVSQPRGDA
jgi:hypothetical protein